MPQFDITSLSSKGQIVIPTNIRKTLGMTTGTKFVVFTDGSNLLLKLVESPTMDNFKNLIQESKKVAKQQKFKPENLPEIIKQIRNR